MSYSHCYYITAGSLVHECIRVNAFDCCCRVNFLELRKAEVHVQSPLPIAISSTTSLLCLNDFDALPLLGSAGEDGVYLKSQEHHKTRHVEPEHEDYHRTELAVDLPVVTQLRDVVAQSAIS